MAMFQRAPAAEKRSGSGAAPNGVSQTTEAPPKQMPLTRAGAAWVGVSAATVLAVLLIIFLVQNTHQVQVDFLWTSTSTSLALMLLIAAVGAILMTVVLGTARIVQLRQVIRRRS